MVYRDSAGWLLTDYPRPSVAVDTAVLTAAPGEQLSVALIEASGPRLPGTFLHEGEELADAVRRSLAQKAGLRGVVSEQLRVFDRIDRDDRGWVLSVAHLATISWADACASGLVLVPVDAVPPMPYDHAEIVARAAAEVRRRYEREPDPAHLLDEPFTLRDLQLLHEAVAGEPLMRDSFRRRMEPHLVPTGELARGVVGKPAREFRRAEAFEP